MTKKEKQREDAARCLRYLADCIADGIVDTLDLKWSDAAGLEFETDYADDDE